MRNTLYYGDNLQVLREHITDESVDLVYLDPPFNSNASYNVLFKEKTGEESPAQIKAFTDTWEWTQETERTFQMDIILNPGTPAAVKDMITAFRQFVGQNAVMAYLVMMTPRLVELWRVLKDTGSLYLHCDPTASHYLKILLDTVFGKENFRNEVVWKRTTAHGDARQGSRHYGRIHDTLLVYAKGISFRWNQQYTPYEQEYIDSYYKYIDENGRRYWRDNLTAAKPGGDTRYEWKGKLPPPGRYWAYSKANMEKLEAEGRIVYSSTGTPMYKRYLDEMPGRPLQDIWDDIRGLGGLGSNSQERLGYRTQKPLALLERIIQASSDEGDVVLDPFCGCGTAVAAAEKLKRQWIGIDITHLAVALMKNRLKTMFNLEAGKDYDVVGEPKDVGSARALAEQDRFQFQYWAISLLEALPQQEERKKGADRGIDGLLYFIDGPRRTPHKVAVQVKSGHVSSRDIRDLKGVVEREKAALGLFITLEEPTREMRTEAASGGFFHSDLWNRDFPKIQIRTVGELLTGQPFDLPPRPAMYQPAERVRRAEGQQARLDELAST
jgi:DNA modification methylase